MTTATTVTTARSTHTYDTRSEDQLHSQDRSVVTASLTQTSFTQRDDYDSDFLILFHAGISSQFLMISRGFNTKCHLLKMLPGEDGERWTRFEYSRCVGGVYGSEQVCLLLLALKVELLSRANYETFSFHMPPEWRCRRWTCFEHSRCMRWCVWQWAGIGFCLHWQLNCFQE